ncbi:hypothetical protein J4466_03385 [Candidatus Pacearchaeota archaeon]|nr:hypothetical protein [Candidatus Pacearchaeota archaeon]
MENEEIVEESMNKDIQESEKIDEKPTKKMKKLEKIPLEKLRGRVIIFNPEESEFAKNLNITKAGDYIQKAK